MKKFVLPVTAHSLVRITSRGTIEISARNKEEALRIARELMESRLTNIAYQMKLSYAKIGK